jgi:uncharacterized protein (TIGR02246 family)
MGDQTKKDPNMEIREIARKNFELWVESLLTKDPKKVAEMYSEDNTFLPTVSGEFKHGKEAAEGYFTHYLEKNPADVIVEDAVQPLGENIYLHSGLYNFEIDKDGARTTVEARFTFVWRKESNGKWKIIHHHSSVRPERS